MKIQTGIFDHAVLQRNRKNVSEAEFSGLCAASGTVTATITRGKRAVKGFSDVPVGKAVRGRMKGRINGLPAGGPYDIEFRVGGVKLAVKDVLVGDVWLLGGQSNMQGCGLFPKERLSADPFVRAFYMNDRWGIAKDPIHNMWECVDQVHIDLCGGVRPGKPPANWGVCPGPAFGLEMRRRTGVPQGLIACAHGGTSMTQWDPGRRNEGGKSLYGAMVRRLVKNGRRVAGMLWYQGCSDATPLDAPLYTKRMQKFVAALRRDCADKALPVAIVQISRVIGWDPNAAAAWNSIQDQERRLPMAINHLACVPVIDLPLDDGIHVSGAGHTVLGARLAQAMSVLRGDRKAGPPPIDLKKTSIEPGAVVLEFKNVAGRLRAGSRPTGFTLVHQANRSNVFDIQLEGRRVRLRSGLAPAQMSASTVHYGYGFDPVCNIVDEAGRSLPVLGPVRLGIPRAATPFVQQLRVSAYQPGAGKLEGLELPASLDSLGLAPRTFPGDFCDLHLEIGKHDGRDEVVWYACRFSCAEAMKLALVFGYDGPLKVWMDGKKVFHDPAGVNPASTEKARVITSAAPGEHEAIMALGTNHGAAWGIYFRFERLDIPRKKILAGPGNYLMPEVLG